MVDVGRWKLWQRWVHSFHSLEFFLTGPQHLHLLYLLPLHKLSKCLNLLVQVNPYYKHRLEHKVWLYVPMPVFILHPFCREGKYLVLHVAHITSDTVHESLLIYFSWTNLLHIFDLSIEKLKWLNCGYHILCWMRACKPQIVSTHLLLMLQKVHVGFPSAISFWLAECWLHIL